MNEEIKTIAEFDPFRAMDMLDDEAILAEIEGRIVEKWVYHFPQEGREVWGLSKVGVDQACTELAKTGHVIREEDVSWTVDPTNAEYLLFKAPACRVAVSRDGKEVMLDRKIGTKRQWTKLMRKDGSAALDPFWFEKGTAKALRNARAALLPEEIRVKIISMAKSMGKVKDIAAEKAAQPQAKPIERPAERPAEMKPAGQQDLPSTSEQRQRIHILCRRAGISNGDYYLMLHHDFGKGSSVELTSEEAQRLIQNLERQIPKKEEGR